MHCKFHDLRYVLLCYLNGIFSKKAPLGEELLSSTEVFGMKLSSHVSTGVLEDAVTAILEEVLSGVCEVDVKMLCSFTKKPRNGNCSLLRTL